MAATCYDAQNLNNYWKQQNLKGIVKENAPKLDYPEVNPNKIQVNGFAQPTYQQLLEMRNEDKNFATTAEVDKFKEEFKTKKSEQNKFSHETTYNFFHGGPKKPLETHELTQQQQIQEVEQELEQKSRYAGTYEREYRQQGIKATSALTGEKFKNDPNEPKDNTEVQRAWIPARDSGLTHVYKNLEKNEQTNMQSNFQPSNPMQTYNQNLQQIKPYDIATSLPMKDGEYALKKKYYNPGEFRHVRADVTIVRNNVITKK